MYNFIIMFVCMYVRMFVCMYVYVTDTKTHTDTLADTHIAVLSLACHRNLSMCPLLFNEIADVLSCCESKEF